MAELPQTWRTPEYKKIYGKLDSNIKEACKIAFKKWRENPDSLNIKPLNKVFGSNEAVSAEISYSVRALGYHNKKKNEFVWFWVGTHEEYNNKITKDFLKTKVNDIKEKAEIREQREAKEQEVLGRDNFTGLKKPNNFKSLRAEFGYDNDNSNKNKNNKSNSQSPRDGPRHK